MEMFFIIAAALLPAILLLLYICKEDPKPEPKSWLIKAVLLGIVIIFPVIFVESSIDSMLFGAGGVPTNLVGTTIQAFLGAALPEELFKLFALWLILRKNPYFDEHFDGIVYAVCIGLGFAAIENVSYVLGGEDWISVAISRALFAVPGHYAFAVLMGYYYSIYHFVDHSPKVAACVLFVPVLAHGIYDSIAFSGMVNPYLGVVATLVLIYFCVQMHKVARNKIMVQVNRDKESNIV